ncbi:MAG: hypothetical protein ACRDTE_30740 [Pseudonocardiaceae bacterium]
MSAPVLLAVTDAQTSLAHLVTLDAMAAGRRRGVYVAVCDTEVVASSLTAEESGHCRRCRGWRAGR